MAISYQHLKQRPFEPVRQHYGERDTMLYALSLGLDGGGGHEAADSGCDGGGGDGDFLEHHDVVS